MVSNYKVSPRETSKDIEKLTSILRIGTLCAMGAGIDGQALWAGINKCLGQCFCSKLQILFFLLEKDGRKDHSVRPLKF